MNREELRAQAAISILNSLLETTSHSVIECLAVRDVYADAAVLYADALLKALDKDCIEPGTILKRTFENAKYFRTKDNSTDRSVEG